MRRNPILIFAGNIEKLSYGRLEWLLEVMINFAENWLNTRESLNISILLIQSKGYSFLLDFE